MSRLVQPILPFQLTQNGPLGDFQRQIYFEDFTSLKQVKKSSH